MSDTKGLNFMSVGRSQRVLSQRLRAPYTTYSCPAKLNAKPWRTFAHGCGKPKLIADLPLYSLVTLSPMELFVAGCGRPDTSACALG
jgi:hypothetical protein